RQALVEVGDGETLLVEAQTNLARLERLAVRLAEDGEDDLVALPVDVEVVHETRARAVLQHARPPGVLMARREMVRDDVEEESHPLPDQLFVQRVEVVVAAELRIQRGGIDDVVAVPAPLARLEDRRG